TTKQRKSTIRKNRSRTLEMRKAVASQRRQEERGDGPTLCGLVFFEICSEAITAIAHLLTGCEAFGGWFVLFLHAGPMVNHVVIFLATNPKRFDPKDVVANFLFLSGLIQDQPGSEAARAIFVNFTKNFIVPQRSAFEPSGIQHLNGRGKRFNSAHGLAILPGGQNFF